jgi:predicted flavoprotein YhiN
VADLSPAVIGLLREASPGGLPADPTALAQLVKALPLEIKGLAGLDRAISTAGGIRAGEIDAQMMLRKRPGVFVAGEMLDWDAPTGGYLLQACFATGAAAGRGALSYLGEATDASPNAPVTASHQS